MNDEYRFKTRLSLFESLSPWYFVEVPNSKSLEIRSKYRNVHRGWGSIPVIARIGDTLWKTSIFWEKKGNYLLFIKKEVRLKENITNGSIIDVSIELKP